MAVEATPQGPQKNGNAKQVFARFFLQRGDALATIVVLASGLGIGVLTLALLPNLKGVGLVGLETFFVVSIAGVFGSEGQRLDQGQIRRGVVAAWVAAFFALLAVGNGIQTSGSVIATTLSQYWWAFTLVFTTYIAGRSAETITTTLKPSGSNGSTGDKNKTPPSATRVATLPSTTGPSVLPATKISDTVPDSGTET
jgi:hypothetical protein